MQKVTRLPAIECAGDRRAWLGWDPRTFREYAMGPTALQLGFRPGGQEFACLLMLFTLDMGTFLTG